MNFVSFLLWSLAIPGVIFVVLVTWARLVVSQMKYEADLYAKSIRTEFPGRPPGITNRGKISEIKTHLEADGFTYIGATCNRTKLDAGRPNIDLVYLSADKNSTAVISCIKVPRLMLYLNLPLTRWIGCWHINVVISTALSDNSWLTTVAMDMPPSSPPPQFRATYCGAGASVDYLLQNHRNALLRVIETESATVKPVTTIAEFLSEEKLQHSILAPDLQKFTTKLIDETSESWPVDLTEPKK